jgi:small subunit ribosomal protein S4
MLPVRSKFKIAKRLGARVFEKTQSQKFALSEARTKLKKRGGRALSDYGRQLIEKQRVRFTYSITEGQLASYADKAYGERNPSESLHLLLEMRLDSAAYAAGFAPTRRGARQMVSHGHILLNGRRVTIPSHQVKKGDVLSVREGSRASQLFAHLGKPDSEAKTAPWFSLDAGLMKAEVTGQPKYVSGEALDYPAVFEFYSR